jgi:23S rRNA (cytidine1920-2'-O)/16S rRNA (cytidine1409-2'-O)-methyltransferase
MSERIDKILVERELVTTRSQALQLIKEKVVFCNDKLVAKASFKVSEDDRLEVRKEHLFVGRGAHKIEGAHKEFSLNFKGLVIADVGASTGGFTEYVLKEEASKVYAIDVGHGQLSSKLCHDSRVINREGINIKESLEIDELCDMAIVDLSFISLRLVAKNIKNLIKKPGKYLFLVKPQFEVGKDFIGKNGIVSDLTKVQEVLNELRLFLNNLGIEVKKEMICTIKGKTGNQEYFFYCEDRED